MHKYLVLLFFVSAISSTAVAAESPTNHYAILPTSEGAALLKQCSRTVPQNVTNYWTPSPSQIAELEKRMPEFLRKNGFKLPFSNFNFQYVGMTVRGKQLIYVNAFPRHIIENQKDWRTKPVIICDGGEAFWGVVFEPADNTFHDLQSNGVA